jgi:LysR family hydrogen peroxide-inducible transcriptional activator
MNLQQLEYIVALDDCKGFVLAAEKCFVTQSTLSIMIKKLEEELGVVLFDRTKQPVQTTELGQKIVQQAKIILYEANKLHTLVDEETQSLSGTHTLGIIPTLAPYLLPLFIDSFLEKNPGITLQVFELTTDNIVKKLISRELDIGILAIPINHEELSEYSLFKEEFVVYAPDMNHFTQKKFLLPTDIDSNKLWLLEEGHCLRNQVINLCELKEKERKNNPLDFSAGSIETLKRMVEAHKGITILPSLCVDFLTERELHQIYYFHDPAPAREIGLITHKYFAKTTLLKALEEEILSKIPPSVQKTQD